MTMTIRVYQENRTQNKLFTLKILAQILFTQRRLWQRKKMTRKWSHFRFWMLNDVLLRAPLYL